MLEVRNLHAEIAGKEILKGIDLVIGDGEIHAIISNVSNKAQTISKDTRVGQLVITPIIIADFVFDLGKERGTDAFGSSGE